MPGLSKCLESSWEGPYSIVKLLHPVNCIIKSTVTIKSKPQTVHASQLKLVDNPAIYRVATVVEDFIDELPRVETSITLSLQQQKQLDNTRAQFHSVFSNIPGLTSLVKYLITVFNVKSYLGL